MPIITISRELASLGDECVSELAKKSGYRFVDRQSVEDNMKKLGISDKDFAKYDEIKLSLFASISQVRDDYLHYLRQTMLTEAQNGDCIFMGRGAFAILNGLPGVLSVFLVSSMKVRIERIKSYFRCDEKRAIAIINQNDQNRSVFHKYFFEIDWKNSENYNLTLNTANLSPSVCADTILNLSKNMFTEETIAQSKLKLNDMIACQNIVNHILYEKKIAVHFLETDIKDGVVTLYGVANSAPIIEAAIAAAQEIPIVKKVICEIQIVQEYSMIP
jgi:cytidylate kinase